MVRAALDPDLLARIKPVTLATQRRVPVPESFAPLFPWGGIPRGSDVVVRGPGAWSLALMLWAEALGDDGWLAVVGLPDLNLAAAAEQGIRLDRVLVVETPGVSVWPAVVATLVEGVDIVAVAPTGPIGVRDARRLQARVRERAALLFHLDAGRSWPIPADLVLTAGADPTSWRGLGWGHGYLGDRVIEVEVSGRREFARPRSGLVTLG